MILDQLFESQTLAEEFGSRYAEQLAQRLYDEHPDLDTAADENEVLDHAFELAQQELGQRRAHSLFAYDEDFAGDLLAAYSVLSQGRGVSEGSEKRFMIYFVVPDVEDYDDHHEPEERTIIVASNRSEAIKKFQAEIPGAYIKDIYPIIYPMEGQQGVLEGVNVKQIKKDLDSGMSVDAVIGKHANRRTTNTDEIRRVIQQHAWEKRQNKTKEQGVEEARYFKTSYGWAGGLNPKTGKKYKHPEQIRIDREARKKQQSQEKSQDPAHWNFGSSVMAEDQRVDPILYKALARMKGDTWLDAETALATQFGIVKKSSDPGLFKDYTQKLLDLYKQKQGVSEAIPSHIKPSDIPPAMRNRRLTMKDIEAERPQGAYRFRVGEKEFMDLAAAKAFAAGTGQKVQPIREAQKKNSSPRIERILKQLRVRYPQAQDDLEALIYDMRAGQRQDRTDINRLDAENDAEEAEIADIERMIKDIKSRRAELAEKRKMSAKDDPCWSGYHMVGTKKKNGREVPNCVPGAKGAANESADGQYAVRVERDSNETIVR